MALQDSLTESKDGDDKARIQSNQPLSNLDVAVAHWHIEAWSGAEYLVTKLAQALGETTVYTVGNPNPNGENPYGSVGFHDVTQELTGKVFLPIKRRAGRIAEYGIWEDVDWRDYGDPDVVITSGTATRAVITPDTTLHLNYCHSPPRWFYDLYHDRKESTAGRLARPVIRYLRTRDAALDDRVDHYFANSPVIARRLWKYYKRDAEILYPPVDLSNYHDAPSAGYFLHLGRLDAEKGVKQVVAAFEGTDDKIVFAGGEGDASVRERIERASNMEYLGFVSESRKYELLSECRAVVFNGRNEDFGIVAIEANASGKPCLARNEGFPGMFIQSGSNGYLHDGSAVSIREATNKLSSAGIDDDPRAFVERFSTERFAANLHQFIREVHKDFQQTFSFHSGVSYE